jgi:hypothetical protein
MEIIDKNLMWVCNMVWPTKPSVGVITGVSDGELSSCP